MRDSATLAEYNQRSLSEIVPRKTDRALLVGMTGSGKTTLARYLLSHRLYKVVADYKGKIRWPEYKLHKTLKTLTTDKSPALLYQPSYDESIDNDARGQFWEWLYKRGNTTAYNDETAATVDGNNYSYWFGAVLMRGREHGIELWSGTQRPKDIPMVVLSESEHVYCFRLRLDTDRERVEQLTGIDKRLIAGLKKQQFLYAPQDGDISQKMKLRL